MRSYTTAEATQFFASRGTDCDENTVEKWILNTPIISRNALVDEWDLYAFNDWLMSIGTSNEPGIDDQIKITRLLEEISVLKKDNDSLGKELCKLATDPDYMPF